jgi:hypothetical protein
LSMKQFDFFTPQPTDHMEPTILETRDPQAWAEGKEQHARQEQAHRRCESFFSTCVDLVLNVSSV